MIYNKKLQVFVSSTFTDLIEERQAAVEGILLAKHIPAGMELFTAGDESQMKVIKQWIDESDVYLLILGGRYGSIDKATGKGYTQLEYEYAIETKKPLFALLIEEPHLEEKVRKAGTHLMEKENPKLLREFREEVKANRVVKFFSDLKDIKLAIIQTMGELSKREDLRGWVPGGQDVNTGALAEEIARLGKENAELRTKIATPNNISEPLFNSLTFEELQKLLTEELVTGISNTENLYHLLLKDGQKLSETIRVNSRSSFYSLYNQLAKYKIIRYEDDDFSYRHFSLTDDGHNFYLKALSKRKNLP